MSSAAIAWPHFVPRLELDVELKAVNARVDEAFKRLDRADPRLDALEARLEALLLRCGSDDRLGVFATLPELAAAEQRLGQQLAKETLDLSVDVEELRAALPQPAAALREEHGLRLNSLTAELAGLQDSLQEASATQRASDEYAAATFATKADHQVDCEHLQRSCEQLLAELQMASASIESLVSAGAEVKGGLETACRRVEELELHHRVTATCVDALRSEAQASESALRKDLATKAALEQVSQNAGEAHNKLDFAMLDRANLRCYFEEHKEVTHKTFSRQQGVFTDFNQAIDTVHEYTRLVADLQHRSQQLDAKFADLQGCQAEQQHALNELSSQQLRDVAHCEDLFNGLQQEFADQANRVQATADTLSTCSTRISLDQLDKTLQLRHAVNELSKEHADLRSTVHGTDTVTAVRGEDGWQVVRSPALDSSGAL
eukprot:TRINITY_DN34730_c0_g1_i1.p1 TRINITY_DN34730_c0_g1~~TRINITY_DN34730_c0_g1_i1.p1  ORF type:complete len:433 (+),score=124.25 TRINITY_DN34730_c0_g1_i1:123-1421(+)